MIFLNNQPLLPTFFPDKTSQVWKVELLCHNQILWQFESESEFMHLAQLMTLIHSEEKTASLELPYLPYARQDKQISKDQTFALHTFSDLINHLNFEKITVLDPHSPIFLKLTGSSQITVLDRIQNIMQSLKIDRIGYPDEGSFFRYSLPGYFYLKAFKKRDPSNGKILSLDFEGNPEDQSILMVDDICDGGMTFILFAQALYQRGAKKVHLYTTHGIYSKGIQVLKDAGINRIFNYQGEIK